MIDLAPQPCLQPDPDCRPADRFDPAGPDHCTARPRTAPPTAALAAARQSAWLARHPSDWRDALLAQAAYRRYGRGERIIGLEEEGTDLCFLYEGAVQVSVARADLQVVPAHMVSPHEWFGEVGAVSGRGNIAEHRAHMSCAVLAIPRAVLQARMAADHDCLAAVTDLLAGSIKTYLELAGGLTGLRSEDRVRSKLYALTGASRPSHEDAYVLRITQEELAAVACVSRSIVWKVVTQLTEDGTIKPGYRRITVLDRERLIAPQG